MVDSSFNPKINCMHLGGLARSVIDYYSELRRISTIHQKKREKDKHKKRCR
jgi:hypothetical protein